MALKSNDIIEVKTAIRLQELVSAIANMPASTIYEFIKAILLAAGTMRGDDVLDRLCRNK